MALSRPLNTIGGSDIAAIMGISEPTWSQAIDVYRRIVDGYQSYEDNEYMAMGRDAEPFIRSVYWRRLLTVPGTRVVSVNFGEQQRRKKPKWASGTPDDLLLVDDELRGVEYKLVTNPTRGAWGEEGTDQFPAQYICQCAYYTWLFGVPHWDLAAYLPYRGVVVFRYVRNSEFEEEIIRRVTDFWENHVEKKIPPPANGSPSYTEYLSGQIEPSDEIAHATLEVNQMAAKYFDIEAKLDLLSEEKERIKQELVKFSDGKVLTGDSWLLRTKKSSRKSTKWKEVTDQLSQFVRPEVYEECVEAHTKVGESLIVTLKQTEAS